jgi:hypothetical protein
MCLSSGILVRSTETRKQDEAIPAPKTLGRRRKSARISEKTDKSSNLITSPILKETISMKLQKSKSPVRRPETAVASRKPPSALRASPKNSSLLKNFTPLSPSNFNENSKVMSPLSPIVTKKYELERVTAMSSSEVEIDYLRGQLRANHIDRSVNKELLRTIESLRK